MIPLPCISKEKLEIKFPSAVDQAIVTWLINIFPVNGTVFYSICYHIWPHLSHLTKF